MPEPDFSGRLGDLCAVELKHALQDDNRLAIMVTAQVESLAATIAIGTGGRADASSLLLEGAVAALTEMVSEKQRAGQLVALLRRGGRDA